MTQPDAQPALERPRKSARSSEIVLTTIYEDHRAEIFAFLVRTTRDRESAEDILQETFIRLIREVRAGRMPSKVRPWLYRVAANAAISRSRRGASLIRLLPRLVERGEPAQPEGEFLRAERDAALHAALGSLSAEGRVALVLAAQGFDGRQIAASIGRTEGATRTLMCRSRIQLRLLLEAAEGQA